MTRSTRLLAFLQLSMLKKSGTYDTLAIFRIPASQRRLEKGPEHETVGIFLTFNGKKSPEHETVCSFGTSDSKKGPDYLKNSFW